MAYPLENALFQWEEGQRALQAIEDPRQRRMADRVVEAIRDELRRRIGPTFSAEELADLYGQGTDWGQQVALDVAPPIGGEAQTLADAAFWLYLEARLISPAVAGWRSRGYSPESSDSDSPEPPPWPASPARRMTIWSASMRTVTSRLPAQCSV